MPAFETVLNSYRFLLIRQSGFNSRDDVIEKAIEVFNSDFPDGDILVEDDPNEVVDQFLNVLAWGKGSQ